MPLSQHLFQIYLDSNQINQRTAKTKAYTQSEYFNYIRNCSNLCLVVLGLIKSGDYLEACTIRDQSTTNLDIAEYITSALHTCGNNAKVYVSENINISKDNLEQFVQNILDNHATIFNFYWSDGGHSVILGKDEAGTPYLLDPQIYNSDGTYPFYIEGIDEIHNHLKTKEVFRYFRSSSNITISETKSKNETCMTHMSPMLINNPSAPRKYSRFGLFSKGMKKRKTLRNLKSKELFKKLSKKGTKKKEVNQTNIIALSKILFTKRKKANRSRRLLKNKLERRVKHLLAMEEAKLHLTKKLNRKKSVPKRPMKSRPTGSKK